MPMASATLSVAPKESPIRLAHPVGGPAATIAGEPTMVAATGRSRLMLGWLEDAGLLLLVVLMFPVVILMVGAPVALVIRLLIQIARRWW